jgi:hypothetical protein
VSVDVVTEMIIKRPRAEVAAFAASPDCAASAVVTALCDVAHRQRVLEARLRTAGVAAASSAARERWIARGHTHGGKRGA